MKTKNLNPEEIWAFYPEYHASKQKIDSLVKLVGKNGWANIPPIPVFEIPEFEEEQERAKHNSGPHHYILIDGNHRRFAAIQIKIQIPAAVYKYEEEIRFRKNKLAYFGYASDPKLYEKLLKAYLIRDKLHEMIEKHLR